MNNLNEIILLCGSGFAYNAWIEEFKTWRTWDTELTIQSGQVLDDLNQALVHFKSADKFCAQYGWSQKDSDELFNKLHTELLANTRESKKNIMIYSSGFPMDISSLRQQYKINTVIWNLMNPWDLVAQRYFVYNNHSNGNSEYPPINLESSLYNWMTDWISEISTGLELQNKSKQQDLQFYSLRMEQVFSSVDHFRQQIGTMLGNKWPNMEPMDLSNFQSLLTKARQNLPTTWNEVITSELGEIALKLGYEPYSMMEKQS